MTPELQMARVWMSTMSYMDTWQLRGPEICSSSLCATDHFGGPKTACIFSVPAISLHQSRKGLIKTKK